ncbi:SpoIIIAH-like family protein [Alteribacillus sp. HJP-4]|uniref:SpoIIIAH-like family protein n=1 Tax=Alteribacillus sp. HJP-4 TaxID=2775394 RepID=UPI0035CD1F41
MVLKKQTVWLLTMISLTIVLAVYYITAPTETAEEPVEEEPMTAEMSEEEWIEWLAEEDIEEEPDAEKSKGENKEKNDKAEDAASEELEVNLNDTGSADFFSEMRIQREEARSRMAEEYTNVIASDEVSAEEKSSAFAKKEEIQQLQQSEEMLESLIQSEGYEEAVVLTEDNNAKIIVQAEEMSKEDAVTLNRLAGEQLGIKDIVIGYQNQNR